MITICPVEGQIYDRVIDSVKGIFTNTAFVLSVTKDCVVNIEKFDDIVYHENAKTFFEKNKHYYDNILTKFVPCLENLTEDQIVLLIHDNIIVTEEVKNLLNEDFNKYQFVSVGPRRQIMNPSKIQDYPDRCCFFTKKSFLKYISYNSNTKEFNNSTTTLEFFMKKLKEEGLEYLTVDNIDVEELSPCFEFKSHK